jgi:hypothetical protein
METSAVGSHLLWPAHHKGADSAAPSNQAQRHRKHFLYVIGSRVRQGGEVGAGPIDPVEHLMTSMRLPIPLADRRKNCN